MRKFLNWVKLPSKNKFSIERLQYHHSVLCKNEIIHDGNKDLIIETLRTIAELMIWGDQHNPRFFEFFLEKGILSFFLKILRQKTTKQVKMQLIQTLSIMIQNIQNETSIYYLMSNNHINDLIVHKFDFDDEELIAYYIMFLKTISLKMNRDILQFFFNERKKEFALYAEAIRFFNHEESMIRIAVRTITLNIFRLPDQAMRKFILDSSAVPYFTNLGWFIRDQFLSLNHLLDDCITGTILLSKLNDCVAEQLDHLYYLNDIYSLRIDEFSQVLKDRMLKVLIYPYIVRSLAPELTKKKPKKYLKPHVALFFLAQIFHIFSYPPLISELSEAILLPNSRIVQASAVSNLESSEGSEYAEGDANLEDVDQDSSNTNINNNNNNNNAHTSPSDVTAGTPAIPISPVPTTPTKQLQTPLFANSPPETPSPSAFRGRSSRDYDKTAKAASGQQKPAVTQGIPSKDESTEDEFNDDDLVEEPRNPYRKKIFSAMQSPDDRMVACALCSLFAIITNKDVPLIVLDGADMLPMRLHKTKRLLAALTTSSPNDSEADLNTTTDSLFDDNEHGRSMSPKSKAKSKRALVFHDDNQQQHQEQDSNDNVNNNDETKENAPELDLQHSEYPYELVDNLISILERHIYCHVSTVHLAIRLLFELTSASGWSTVMNVGMATPPADRPCLDSEHKKRVLSCYNAVRARLRETYLSDPKTAELIISCLDVEYKEYKRLICFSAEMFLAAPTHLLPFETAPKMKKEIELSKRFPDGTEEIIRTDVQMFIAFYHLHNAITGEPDEILAAMYKNSIPKFYADQDIDMHNREAIRCNLQIVTTSNNGNNGDHHNAPAGSAAPPDANGGATPARIVTSHARYLFVEGEHLVLVEPKPAQLGKAFVREILPLMFTKVASVPEVRYVLLLNTMQLSRNGGEPEKVFEGTVVFEDFTRCKNAKNIIARALSDVKNKKMRALETILNIERDSDTLDADNHHDMAASLPPTPMEGVLTAASEASSSSLMKSPPSFTPTTTTESMTQPESDLASTVSSIMNTRTASSSSTDSTMSEFSSHPHHHHHEQGYAPTTTRTTTATTSASSSRHTDGDINHRNGQQQEQATTMEAMVTTANE